jgi:beta-lactamase class A
MSEPELAQFAEELEAQISATVHVSIQELASGRTLNYKSNIRCKSASVIKLPILIEAAARVHAGDIHWHLPLTLRDSDKVGGSGILTDLTSGTALTLRDICMLMIVLSDNTAANMLIDFLGVEAITERRLRRIRQSAGHMGLA